MNQPKPGEVSGLAFTEFVLSIATNAVMHLGGDDSSQGRIQGKVDLAQASQHIDILVMLKDKTRGNLEQKEQVLLDSLLYDLRMKYVEMAQAQREG